MEWINPHAWIHMDVKGDDGKVVNWMVETGSPNILLRRGFTKKSLEQGTEIVVQGYMAKDGENKINGGSSRFRMANGSFSVVPTRTNRRPLNRVIRTDHCRETIAGIQ